MAAEYALPVAREEKAVEQAADELYGLAPGEFTSARDARAKELRGAGDREAANAVKALRKPTVAAWALNQLSRRKGKDLDRLLAAGEKLRGAQEELLAGGDRSAFQKAAARERELVAELTATAIELAGEGGTGLEEKVAATLHAAALDEDAADELRAGRLLREREAIGGFGAAPSGGESRPAPRAKKPAPAARKRDAKSEQAKADDARARERLAAARTDERHARRELEAAEKALGSAATRAEAAEAHADDASKRAKTAKQRLEEARRAQTAARKAHTRAEKALAAAEKSG
jgi:hypothetical protein